MNRCVYKRFVKAARHKPIAIEQSKDTDKK